MTLNATQANQITQNIIGINADRDFVLELQGAEAAIRAAIHNERFETIYNATILGNPAGNPNESGNVSVKQQPFLDHFINDGYTVNIDPDTGWWYFNWRLVGAEAVTQVYSIRTTVPPGSIVQATIDAINNFFQSLIPRASVRTVQVDKEPTVGGDIPESDFGATDSVFYEYLAIVQQQDDTDHSVDLMVWLRATGLGYRDDTRVVGVGGAPLTTTPTNTLDISNGAVTVTVAVGGSGTGLDLVNSININPTLQAMNIRGDVDGTDVVIINELGGTLIVTNNVGDVLGDIFTLSSPQAGVLTDNTEVYRFA